MSVTQAMLPLHAHDADDRLKTRFVRDAAERIDAHLASCLPPGTPAIHQSVESAWWVKKGRGRTAIGKLILFDGQPATIEVFQWAAQAFGHRWLDMVGGAAFYEDGRWQREEHL